LTKIKIEDVAVLEDVPPLELPFAEIVSPRPKNPVEVIVVNSRPIGVYTHYVNGRTKPHLRDRALCEGCQQARKRTYKCYLGGWLPGKDQYCLVEVTHFAAEQWKRHIDDVNKDWRGARIKVTRLGTQMNSRCKLDVSFDVHPKDKLPPPLPIMEILLQIWGGEKQSRRPRDGATVHAPEEVPE
jgi:hypothetical protein